MNILFLIGNYRTYGGTEKVTTILANALFEKGHRVIVAAFHNEVKPSVFGLHSDVSCLSLDDCSLRDILVDNQIEVIINQWCLPYFVTRAINRARKRLPVRLISVLHGVPDRSRRVIRAEDDLRDAGGMRRIVARLRLWALEELVRASLRYVYRRSDAYVVLSPAFLQSFRSYAGLKGNLPKLVAIGNPISIETDYVTDWLSRKRKQILYVGRMDKANKRVNRIVEAWEALAGDYPDWNVVLVGDGPHLSELKAYASERAIPRIEFKGFIPEDPIRYYQESSIFMLTSDLEGFGLVLVEAMSYGVVPVVYGSYAAVHDVIDDGRCGLVTGTPYSQSATIAAMRRLMDDEALRVRMSRAAVEKSKGFTLEHTLAQWRALGVGT